MLASYYGCLTATWKYDREVEFFWISGILLVIVGIFGIIGTILALVVLCRSQLKRKVFYQLLIGLASFDLLFIASYGVCVGYRGLACTPVSLNIYFVTYPILNIGFAGSIFMTVAISIERYIGVCHPNVAVRKKASVFIVPVLLLTFLFTLPRLVEKSFKVVNGTIVQEKMWWAETEMYKVGYYLWANIIVLSIIPTLSLVFFNAAIIKELWKSSQSLRMFGVHHKKRDRKSLKILFCIVSLFLVCHCPRIVYRLLYYLSYDNREYWWSIVPIYKLALVLNSSTNCLIYYFAGDVVQTHCSKLFCKQLCSKHIDKDNVNVQVI